MVLYSMQCSSTVGFISDRRNDVELNSSSTLLLNVVISLKKTLKSKSIRFVSEKIMCSMPEHNGK